MLFSLKSLASIPVVLSAAALLLGSALPTNAARMKGDRPQTGQQTRLFERLKQVNRNWTQQNLSLLDLNPDDASHLSDDRALIQTHLRCVIDQLGKACVDHLNDQQRANRLGHIATLEAYRKRGQFPQNVFVASRRPVFIDPWGTHCAVGYLIKESGHASLAKRINREHALDYLRDIKTVGLDQWQAASGLSLDELALIQPSYAASSLRYPQEIEALILGDSKPLTDAIQNETIRVDSRCGGKTPLHFAAASGDLKLVRLLVDKGADLEAVSKSSDVSIKKRRGQFVVTWNKPTQFFGRLAPGSGIVARVFSTKRGVFVAEVLQDLTGGLDGKTPLDYATMAPIPTPYRNSAGYRTVNRLHTGARVTKKESKTTQANEPAEDPAITELKKNRVKVAQWIRQQKQIASEKQSGR